MICDISTLLGYVQRYRYQSELGNQNAQSQSYNKSNTALKVFIMFRGLGINVLFKHISKHVVAINLETFPSKYTRYFSYLLGFCLKKVSNFVFNLFSSFSFPYHN